MPPPDGITSGTSRGGLTERPPATPGPASRDDDAPAPRLAAGQILDRVLMFAGRCFPRRPMGGETATAVRSAAGRAVKSALTRKLEGGYGGWPTLFRAAGGQAWM